MEVFILEEAGQGIKGVFPTKEKAMEFPEITMPFTEEHQSREWWTLPDDDGFSWTVSQHTLTL